MHDGKNWSIEELQIILSGTALLARAAKGFADTVALPATYSMTHCVLDHDT